ncbi:MAG: hypothetical protein FWF81_03275 [Defluviitaleaceae bacterium]|nr:hypothetical protein [Defluviitaleaceae bacterium]
MKCPNCQKNFNSGVKCPNCKVDTVLYIGTVRLSDKLHNKGLERLKANDFYHGIEALAKSISINKNNVPSRNLLGLALFEIGHVGEALKHWVISKSMLQDDNPAEKYIESVHKNSRKLEQYNDAVGMFNQALGHIKQKSDDLAIIQLKKAVEINPRFVDALNLLTLCYLIQNDRERATTMAERVISIDSFNPVALNYYTILNPGKKLFRPASSKKMTAPLPRGTYTPIGLEDKKPRNFHFAELFTFLIGVAVTVAACYFLLIPALERSQESDVSRLEQDFAEARAENLELLNQAEAEQDELRQEILTLSDDIASLVENLSVEQRINAVNHAYFLYLEDELRMAVDTLEGMDMSDLPHDIQQRLTDTINSAYPRLGLNYYNAGLSAFNAPRDAYMALVNLENAHRFMSQDVAQYNRLLFMLGVLYFDEDRFDEAYDILSILGERAPNLPSPFTGAERTLFSTMMNRIEEQR